MRMPEPPEPSCAMRGLLGSDGVVRLVTRNLSFGAMGSTAFDPDAKYPAALDLLVGALVTDLLSGLHREARRDGVTIHGAEASIAVSLDNPLVALGVVGEVGLAAIATIRGSIYASCDAPAESMHALWQRVLARAPVHATLTRSADVHLELQLVS
jgi:hypothetical protein